jgi:DNA-binding NarL/FixJ family response regulator
MTSGTLLASDDASNQVRVQSINDPSNLSEREQEALHLVDLGYTSAEIAEKLSLLDSISFTLRFIVKSSANT